VADEVQVEPNDKESKMNATMTKTLRAAAEAVLVERWERELRSLGLARETRKQLGTIKKMTDRQVWAALKLGA
jgi:hypothetical protein